MSYTDGRALSGMNDDFTDAAARASRVLIENAAEIITGDPNGFPDVLNVPPNNGGSGSSTFDFSQALATVQQAPITQDCKNRFNTIVNGIANGSISGPAELAWAQAVAQAAQGIGDYPSECMDSGDEPMAWYWWLVIGGGAAILVYLLYFRKRRRK